MDVRPLRSNESGREGFLKFPTEAQYLSIQAKGLLVHLLLFGGGMSGALDQVGHGLSQREARIAAAELRDAGLLGFEEVRRPDGTTARVPWVTAISGVQPDQVERRVTSLSRTPARISAGQTKSQRRTFGVTRGEAASPQVAPSVGYDVRSEQHEHDVSAGQTKSQRRTFGVTRGETASPQVAPSSRSARLARAAETHPADDVSAGQADMPSRARLPYGEEEEPPPYPPRALPGQRDAARTREEEGPSVSAELMQRAYAIMESLQRLPVSRGGHKHAPQLAYAIAQRLAIGRTEAEIRTRLDAPLPPDKPVVAPYALLLGRIGSVPLQPLDQGRVRESDRSVDEVRERLADDGAELYARGGERPGTVDVTQVAGGWRAYVARKQEGSSDG